MSKLFSTNAIIANIKNLNIYIQTLYDPNHIICTAPQYLQQTGNAHTTLVSKLQKVCPTLGPKYVKNGVENALNQDNLYIDILIMCSKNQPYKIVSLLVVLKGECKFLPEVWSVSLVCSVLKNAGSIMLAAFMNIIALNGLNSINNNQFQGTISILDLALRETNIGALCVYSKLGYKYMSEKFRYADTYGNCYNLADGGPTNLPMVAMITQDHMKPEWVIQLACGKITPYQRDSLCVLRGDDQQLGAFIRFYEDLEKISIQGVDLNKYVFDHQPDNVYDAYELVKSGVTDQDKIKEKLIPKIDLHFRFSSNKIKDDIKSFLSNISFMINYYSTVADLKAKYLQEASSVLPHVKNLAFYFTKTKLDDDTVKLNEVRGFENGYTLLKNGSTIDVKIEEDKQDFSSMMKSMRRRSMNNSKTGGKKTRHKASRETRRRK